jgi:hypothetical protein
MRGVKHAGRARERLCVLGGGLGKREGKRERERERER